VLNGSKLCYEKTNEKGAEVMKRKFDSKFKSRVALEALRGEKTIAEIAGEFQVHPNQVMNWKRQLLSGAEGLFQTKGERQCGNEFPEETLLKKIGRLEVENDFLRRVSSNLGLK
jgi:transposase-like protein